MAFPLDYVGGEVNYTPLPQTVEQKIELIETTLPAHCNEFLEEINKYDWDTRVASQIMFLESSCNPNALNNNPNTGDYSVGLFQVNLYGNNAKHRPSESELKNPKSNIAYAYKLYTERGFHPWTVYKKVI